MPALEPPTPDEEPATGLRYRVTSATSATFLIFVIDRLVQVAFLAVLARVLLPAEVAVSAAATLFVTLLALIAHMGVPAALIQQPNLSERTVLVGRTLVVAAAFAAVVIAELCAPLVGDWFREPKVTQAVRVLAALCLIQAMTFAPHALLTRRLEARYLSLVDLGAGVVGQGLVAIPLALAGWSYWALIAGTLAQALTRMGAVMLVQRLPLRGAFDRAEARRLWGRGVGFSLTTLLHRLATESDRIIVGRYIGAVGLGLYARANGLMAFPAALYGAVTDRVAFPAFALVQREPDRLATAYAQAMALTALIAAPATVLLIMVGPEVIRFILGPHWLGAIEPFKILSVAVFFRMADRVNGTLLRGVGKPYLLAIVQACVVVFMIGGCLAVAGGGITAVAAVAATASLVSNLLLTATAMRAARLTLGALAVAYRPAIFSALLIAAAVGPITWFARGQAWSAFAILAAAGVAATAVGLAAALFAPRIFLGHAGRQATASMLAMVRPG